MPSAQSNGACPRCRELERQLKLARDFAIEACRQLIRRDSSNRNEERDSEITRLRNTDPRRWTWKALGRHAGVTADAARKAYERCMREMRSAAEACAFVRQFIPTAEARELLDSRLAILLAKSGTDLDKLLCP